MTIAEVLEADPATAEVFHGLKARCPECSLVRLCTLRDVARAYQLEERVLLTSLRNALVLNAKHRRRNDEVKS